MNRPEDNVPPSSASTSVRREIVRRARAAWPRFETDVDEFGNKVVALLSPELPSEAALKNIRVEDLYLAHACSEGDQRALQAFATESARVVLAVAKQLRVPDDEVEDVRQRLWYKLFVKSAAGHAKILDYRGTGQLRDWLRVLAARLMLDQLRKQKRRESDGRVQLLALTEPVVEADPEARGLQRQYRHLFRRAFESAVSSLGPEERNILRCHYVAGMSTDQIGKAFGIHKATAARHLARARSELLDGTRARLKVDLSFDSYELNSAMRLFDGELSISLSRLLG